MRSPGGDAARAGRILLGSLAAMALVTGTACSRGDRDHERSARQRPAAVDTVPTPAPLDPGGSDAGSLLRHEYATLYFPSAQSSLLVGETHEIVRTSSPGDRVKQILSDLIAGPQGKTAVASLPPETKLRQVYVLDDGTAYADFSEDLRSKIGGGSEDEILTVYSIVNSVTLNVREISRVAILVEGRPCETLNGHLDLRRPLRPDRKLIFAADEEGSEPEAPAGSDPASGARPQAKDTVRAEPASDASRARG